MALPQPQPLLMSLPPRPAPAICHLQPSSPVSSQDINKVSGFFFPSTCPIHPEQQQPNAVAQGKPLAAGALEEESGKGGGPLKCRAPARSPRPYLARSQAATTHHTWGNLAGRGPLFQGVIRIHLPPPASRPPMSPA